MAVMVHSHGGDCPISYCGLTVQMKVFHLKEGGCICLKSFTGWDSSFRLTVSGDLLYPTDYHWRALDNCTMIHK